MRYIMVEAVAVVAAVASWLAAVWQSPAVPEHSSLVAAAGHSSLGALARRSLGVEVGHSSLGALVAAVVGHLVPVTVHLAHRLLGVAVGQLAHRLLGVIGYPSPAEEVEHHPAVLLVSDWASECLGAHWDWGVADTRYYSQLDLLSIAWVDTACWGLGQHTVLGHRWVADCQVDWDPVVAEYHSMVAGYWATTGWHQREEDFHHLDLRQVVGAPALRCALLLGVILD